MPGARTHTAAYVTQTLLLALLVFVAPTALAEADSAGAGAIYEQWDVAVWVSGGPAYSFNPTIWAGGEILFASVPVGSAARFGFGGATRAVVTYYDSRLDWGWLAIGAGWFAVGHLTVPSALRAGLDINLAVGGVLDFYLPTGDWERYNDPNFARLRGGIAAAAGVNFFLTSWLAIRIEAIYWMEASYWDQLGPGGGIGLLLKL